MNEIELILKTHPFLAGMPPEHVAIMARKATRVHFEPDQIIFREGEPANRLYLIQSGKVSLESRGAGRGLIQTQLIGPGEALGWSWLFPPFTWHFQARAIESTDVVSCDAGNLLVNCEENAPFGYNLMRRISGVVIKRMQAARKQLIRIHGVLNPPQVVPTHLVGHD